MSNKAISHNLNINMYSLDELFGLFDLTHKMTLEDLRRAKKSVLMLHPDKSGLSADYFIFYKKAFEMVVQYFHNEHKTNIAVTEENSQYKLFDTQYNKATVQKVKTMVTEMPANEFQNKFNQIFEENMASKPDTSRNEWFKTEDPIFKTDQQVSSKNMGQVFDQFKQQSSGLVQYRGVQHLTHSSGTQLYDDDDNEQQGHYITSDPFSKLKFDDLRKVHKDQTILAVSERDYANVQKFSSVDQYNRERSKQMAAPLEKQEAEKLLEQQNALYRQQILKKEHAAKLRTMEYEEKNKTIMSNFLRLK